MADIASLGIGVDTRQIKEGKKALDDLVTSGGNAEAATKKLSDATNTLSSATKKANDSNAKAAAALDSQSERAKKFVDSILNANENAKKLEATQKRLAAAAKQYETSLAQTKSASNAAQDSTVAYIAKLEKQIALYGKSSTEALRYEASMLGATKAQQAHIQELLKTAEAQEASAQKTNILASAVKLLVAAYASLKVLDYIKDSAMLQARYETLGVSMMVVGRNAGYSTAQMEAAAVGLQKTGISMIESRQQILRLVQAQIDLSKASQLARIAQDAAVIGNVNSSEAFARLIHGIQTGQPEVLRMLGINVSMERSYRDMAKSLGVTTGQLTQAQRTQAVLNSVMAEGESIAGIYEAAMSTAGKQISSMQRYTENLKLTIGETFNEALVIAVEAATAGLKGMNKEAQDLAVKGQLREWGREAIMVAANVIDVFRLIKNVFVQAGNGIMFLVEATQLALKGQFSAIKELSIAQEKENAEFVKNITLVSDMARQRFALVDRERMNAKTTDESTKKIVKHTEGLADDTAAIKKAETAYQSLIKGIREKIAIQEIELLTGKSLTDSQKTSIDAMVKLRDGQLNLTDAKKMELVAELERLSAVEKSVENMQFSKQAGESLIKTSQQQVLSLQEQVIAMREQNAMYGATKEQLLSVAGAKNLELAANIRNAAVYAGPLHDAYITHANDLEKLGKLQKELVSEQQIAKTAEEWTRIGQTIEQTGKSAFVQFASHGVSAMKSIGAAIKTSLFDLLYQLTVRKWMINITTSFTSALASGAAEAAGGAISSGGGSSFLGAIGSLFGLGGAAGGAAGAAGGAGGAAGAAGGAAGMAGGLGAALPVVGAFLAAGALGSAFGSGKKIFGIKGDSILNFIPFAPGVVGLLAGLFGKGPKQLGPAELTGDFAEDGFRGEFQADWKRKVGLFGGKKRGRRGLGIEDEQVEALNDTLFGIEDTFQGLIKITGDSARSLDGWSFAVKRQIETEEQQNQLWLDLSNSMGEKLIPELLEVQQKGEELAGTAARIGVEFAIVNELLDLTGKTLNTVGLASIKARDNIIQQLGGVDAATGALQAFYQNFYSDAERIASSTRLLTKELSDLGFAMPTSMEQYRALVEAQNLNTEAGQKAFASLVKLSPIFTVISNAAAKAADDMAAEAKRIAESFKLLGKESFSSLFDYTRYIRKAANAGVLDAQPENIFQKPDELDQRATYPSFAIGTNSLPRDMTINAHAGERIMPAADNSELMARLRDSSVGMQVLVDQLRRLREESRAHALAIAKNTAKTAKLLDQFDGNGMPPERP